MESTSIAIIAVVVTILIAGSAALWHLANSIRDRPTSEYIDDKFTEVHKDIKDIQIESAKQSVTLSNIENNVKRLARRADSQPITG